MLRRASNDPTLEIPWHLAHRAALMLVDISGFVGLSRQFTRRGAAGIEALSQLLNTVFAEVLVCVRAYGGEVEKFIGDAVLLAWPAISGDLRRASQRAAECALRILSDVRPPKNAGAELRFHIGLSAGAVTEIHVGVPSGAKFSFFVGDPLLELASTLAAAGPGELCVSASAWPELSACFSSERRDENVYIVTERTEAISLVGERLLGRATPDPERIRGFVQSVVRDRLALGDWLAELRQITALFVNVPRPELTSAASIATLQSAIVVVEQYTARMEGELYDLLVDEKGFTLIVVFGHRRSHENDATRAVLIAQRIERIMASHGFESRAGVATGKAYCGVIGSDWRRGYTIIGDVMNLASRLMGVARGIYVDEPTYSVARERVSFASRPPVTIKGHAEPVPTYQPSERGSVTTSRIKVQMIGRARERELLAERFRALVERDEGSVVVIRGEPGMGKSRLLAELKAYAEEEMAYVMSGEGDSIERGEAYGPLREGFAELLGTAMDDPPEKMRRAIQATLVGAPARFERASLLNQLLPAALPATDYAHSLSEQGRADNLHALLAEIVGDAAGVRPLVVSLDNGNWFDSATWALLRVLIQSVPNAMYVIATRPLDAEPPGYAEVLEHPRTTVLDLEGLPEPAIVEIVRRRLRVRRLPTQLIRLIRSKAEGNPFFSEELTVTLLESGHLDIRSGNCVVTTTDGELSDVALPQTVQGVVTARLDLLPPDDKLFLKVASVVGRAFTLAIINAIFPRELAREEVQEIASRLVELRLLRPLGKSRGGYEFAHITVQEAVYEVMLVSQRRALHAAVCDWYERHGTLDPGGRDLVLAYHSTRAGAWERAVPYLERAGAHSFSHAAYSESVDYFSQALRIADEARLEIPAARRGRWRWHVAEALFRLGDMGGCLEQGLVALKLYGHPMVQNSLPRAIKIARTIARRSLVGGVAPAELPAEERALRVDLLELHVHLADAFGYKIDVAGLINSLIAQLELAESIGSAEGSARAWLMLSFLLALTPMRNIGVRWLARALTIAEQVEDRSTLVYVYGRAGVARLWLGEPEAAESLFRRAEELAREIGDHRQLCEVSTNHALKQLVDGRFADADAFVRATAELTVLTGDKQARAWSQSFRGYGLLRVGAVDEAAYCVSEIKAWLEAKGETATQVLGFGARALVLLHRGELDLALALVEKMSGLVKSMVAPLHWMYFGIEAMCEVTTAGWARARGGELEQRYARLRKTVVRQASAFARQFLFAEPLARYFEGVLLAQRGRSRRAIQAWRSALDACAQRSARYIQLRTHDALAELLGRASIEGAAQDDEARALAEELGCERAPAYLEGVLTP